MKDKTNNPSSTFWWKDYAADTGLMRCSYAAQGFWMRCLCIMASADGYLKDGNLVLTAADLSLMLPGNLSPEQCEAYLNELLRNNVATKTRQGCVFNRRMVRAKRVSAVNSANGKKGGVASVQKQKGIHGRPGEIAGDGTGGHPGGDKGGGAGPTTSSSSTPSTHPPPGGEKSEGRPELGREKSERAALAERVVAAIGVGFDAMDPRLSGGVMPAVESLIAGGCDFVQDIAPALASRPEGGDLPATAAFWTTIARSNRTKREKAGSKSGTAGPAHPATVSVIDARNRMTSWTRRKTWLDEWGPKPGEPGCLIPASIQQEFMETQHAA